MSERHDDSDSLALLTPVLELAVVIAQTGERAVPPLTPPALLRPFVNFTRRIPTPALRAARRVLDEDEVYRARVATVVTEDLVGRAGVLFAARPEGWEDELAALTARTADEDVAATQSKSDRKLERRVTGAEAATRRAEDGLAKTRVELAQIQGALAGERAARAAIESSLEDARRSNALLEEALAGATASRDEARAALGRVTEDLGEALEELAVLRHERRVSRSLEEAVRDALVAVERVRTAVVASRAPLDHLERPPANEPDGANAVRRPTRSRAERFVPRAGRTAAPLPPAVFADSTAAAQHLLRITGVVVLVDGYNVTKWKWTTLPPADQRRRLLDALEELAARTGAEFQVVFDGADDPFVGDVVVAQGGGLRARTVKASFSPPRVDADDVILAAIEAIPIQRPVVVVSSDRRVREGAEERGANVLTSQQFVASWGPVGSLSYPSR